MRAARAVGPRGASRRARPSWSARLALSLLLVVWAAPAWAATTIAFYSHPWGMGKGGFIYFPHAFVVIERTSDDGTVARESYGFTAVNANAVLLAKKGVGKVTQPDPRYAAVSRLHFKLSISDAQYQAAEQAIAGWDSAYDLDKRNCIAFVAAVARAAGLDVGDSAGRDPAKFLERVRQANAARLAADAQVVLAPAPASPVISSPAP